MRARLHEVACGLMRNHVDVGAERMGDWWWFDRPIQLVNKRGDIATRARIHDHDIIHKTDEAPEQSGASPIGDTP